MIKPSDWKARVLSNLCLVLCGCLAPAQSSPPPCIETARSQCAARKWAEAIDTLNAILRNTPTDVEALRWRAHAFTGSEQHERARIDLAMALELGASDAWTHYAHAMALHHVGQLDAAVAGYTAALAIDPEFTKAYEWRGFTLTRLGKPLQALPDLDHGVRADDGNPWLRTIRGKLRASLCEFVAAEEDLWRAADADPNNSDVIGQLGYLLVATGQPAIGRRHLERALELDARHQGEARAWLYHILTDAGNAKEAATQIEALRSDSSRPWPSTIAAYLAGNITSEALRAEVGKSAPSQQRQHRCAAWLHTGLVARREGRDDAALAAFARAVATDVRDEWEWTWARQCLREMTNETQ